jgi:hypothetical protein
MCALNVTIEGQKQLESNQVFGKILKVLLS